MDPCHRRFVLIALLATCAVSCARVQPATTATRTFIFGDDHDPIARDQLGRCESKLHGFDRNNVRACLVPEGDNADLEKEVAPGCYWLDLAPRPKYREYRVKADNKHKRFTFEVINLCDREIEVYLRFKPPSEGRQELQFSTRVCKTAGAIPLGMLGTEENAVLACDTILYKAHGGGPRKDYGKKFDIFVNYDGREVAFDPEILIKDAG